MTGSFLISGAGGLGVQLGSDTRFNVVNAGSSATISAPINGAFSLIKQGAGTLVLSGANTATGFTLIEGGTLDAASATSIASGNIAISNDAVLRTSGTLENTIETRPGASGIAGSAQIVAPTGSTLTLTGFIRHASTGTLTFGSASDTGTIVADTFGAFTAHEKSYQLAGGTLRFANANSASNLLSFPALFGTGKTSIDAGAVLDTGGFHTVIGSLDLDGGIIRSSTGALDLEVSISHATTATQNGVFQGTSSSDQVQLNVYTSLNLSQTNFVNWTTGADQIIINGLVGVGGIFTKNVEIVGSNRSDIITCAHGDDDIFGYMGIDMIDGEMVMT
ncbi:MAG: autotransporter-associated beta strand repeat-containing protein [Sphingomonadales bacterium]|nr:autotransporter-associated beta strand repeat-containing protein [Sphingomonadales bacterium]